MAARDSEDFDDWYRAVINSPARDAFVGRWLSLPASVESTGYLTGDGLAEVLDVLDLDPHKLLVEIGCGRAGYGLAAAQATGAALVGVDFSPVAIASARVTAGQLQLAHRAWFQVGDLVDSGLDAGSADAVLCIDSIHFASSVGAAAAECRRLLVPGGRVVITTWEPADRNSQLPDRIRRMAIGADLQRAGFADIRVVDRPAWQEAELALWTAAAALEPGSDPAMLALKEEAEQFLPLAHSLRRVLVVAAAP